MIILIRRRKISVTMPKDWAAAILDPGSLSQWWQVQPATIPKSVAPTMRMGRTGRVLRVSRDRLMTSVMRSG